MEAYLKDELIDKCFSATIYSTKKLLEIIPPEEIRKIDVNSVWIMCRRILADERIKKKDRLKLAMTVGKGAMIIRGEKLKLIQKKLNTFVKKMEHIDVLAKLDNMEREEPKIDIAKLIEVPDIDLKFPMTPDNQYLLSDPGEEMNLLHSGNDSDFSFIEDLTENMRDLDEFINQHRVPEGQQTQSEQNPEEEQQVPDGKQKDARRKTQDPRDEQQVPEGERDADIGSRSDMNMEVDENAAAPLDVTIFGTPSKRAGSVIRGDDTPSKRGRFSSLITDSRKEQTHEGSTLQGVSGINPLDVTDREVGPQPEAGQEQLSEINQDRQRREEEEESELRDPGRLSPHPQRRRIKKGRDEITTLSDKWFKDFQKRTNFDMGSPIFYELKEGIPTKLLVPANLMKMPGFTIQNENLRELFEQSFHGVIYFVEPEEEDEDRSPERSPQRREEIREQEWEQVRDQPDESNLIESRPENEPTANVDETIDRRVSMGRVPISRSPDFADLPVPTTPEVPYQSMGDSAAAGMEDSLADNLPRNQVPQDNSLLQRSDDEPQGITKEKILALIFDQLTLEDRDFLDLKEIIPPESNNKETAAWSFLCLLELKKKKKIVLSQEGSKEPIHVSLYKEK